MRAGNLRNLITIERKVTVGSTSADFFEANEVWQIWREVFCGVEVRRGREHFDPATKQRYAEDVWLFTVRFDEVIGVSADMRIQHDGMAFDIRSTRPDGQHQRFTIIECTVQDAVLRAEPLAIAVEMAIPAAEAGEVYAGFTVTASGGTGPYSFVAESGSLPPGLTLNPTTGLVAGTPTVAGVYAVDIDVTDAAGDVASLPAISLTVTV